MVSSCNYRGLRAEHFLIFPLESRHGLTCLLTSVWCWCVRCVGLSRLYIYAGLSVPQSGRVVYALLLIWFCCMGLVLIKPGINPSGCLCPFALVSTPCWCHHHTSLNFLPLPFVFALIPSHTHSSWCAHAHTHTHTHTHTHRSVLTHTNTVLMVNA